VNSQILALTLARHFFAKQYQDQNGIEDQAYPHQGEARPCFRIARKSGWSSQSGKQEYGNTLG
jgi:hypothetical protein